MFAVREILLHKPALTVSENLTDFPSAETSCTSLIANSEAELPLLLLKPLRLGGDAEGQVEGTGTLISLKHLKQSFIGVRWMFSPGRPHHLPCWPLDLCMWEFVLFLALMLECYPKGPVCSQRRASVTLAFSR